jgi:hypothetical protein
MPLVNFVLVVDFIVEAKVVLLLNIESSILFEFIVLLAAVVEVDADLSLV